MRGFLPTTTSPSSCCVTTRSTDLRDKRPGMSSSVHAGLNKPVSFGRRLTGQTIKPLLRRLANRVLALCSVCWGNSEAPSYLRRAVEYLYRPTDSGRRQASRSRYCLLPVEKERSHFDSRISQRRCPSHPIHSLRRDSGLVALTSSFVEIDPNPSFNTRYAGQAIWRGGSCSAGRARAPPRCPGRRPAWALSELRSTRRLG